MSELGILLGESVERLFADHPTAAAQGADGSWLPALWNQLEEIGVNLTLVAERHGGASGGWEDVFAVLRLAGAHTIPLPIAESMLAAKLLSDANLEFVPGVYSIATRISGDWNATCDSLSFSGELASVPWGRHADHIVCCAQIDSTMRVCVLPRAAANISAGSNLAGEPRDTLRFIDVPVRSALSACPECTALFDFCALARLPQIVGCLDSALSRSIQYATERKQFGRAIGQFQAVQHLLAVFGGEVAAASCVARAACRAADAGNAEFQIAAAKLRANQAIGLATASAHQVHGAIGFTNEYALHFATQRLWSWRSEFGSDRYWSERLGSAVARAGADCFWPDMTARDDAVG
jgi:acyl-CoA dehydrogenase